MHKYMHIHACINIHTHAQTHNMLIKLFNYYNFTLAHKNRTNLGATCGAPTKVLAVASGTAEDVVG